MDSSLVDDYLNWLKGQYSIEQLNGSQEIVTPFTNSIGDNITIYVSSNSDGKITLTDDFDTIGDLEMMGINFDTIVRKKYLNSILNNYNVQCVNKELFVMGDKIEFPEMKQRLMQAIIRIDDLLMTRKENYTSFFKSDVYQFFEKNDFGGLKTYRPYGESGNNYVVDYTIPLKGNRPFRFINFTNTSSFSTIAMAGAMYGDIATGSEYNLSNSEFVIIYNSQVSRPSHKSINIAQRYDLKLISWEDKSKIMALK
ncbi:DUF1828 domain-containing protein [Companilactobacillus bobalius]|uniref:DUF1828 domain-containing protein n=2 Tax=Companilactobacillus bobalius TaxID=2801451 RepID=A0A202F933_9LACO|nr:DUF1828 domain-containing protein [Companilactobacillus bobalius]KAE9561408.1 hypothetical protein ATN92_04810 [Companilactobacillus bobalius]KRK82295.1 hypothetical protein FC78_GL002300 [Companilactobacillus bobalius DSM 19674]OVE96962.1 hypothetical protein LKACC16343_01972 [Companilactobacillus bobalius]GEO59346.1 hypothetical protein LBO01_24750 [Companilactobacillus paralimentarius]